MNLTIPLDFIVQAYNHFAPDLQLDILQEECAELIQAISKIRRYPNSAERKKNLIEEMTHVLMSIQLNGYLHGVTQDDILQEVDRKADEYYFNNTWRREINHEN